MSGPFKMKGYSYPGTSPIRNKDTWVEHTYPAGHVDARGGGYESTSGRTVQMTLGTKRLIDANAPLDVINKSKKRDLELLKTQQTT